jgi:hypothetical protein
VVSVTVDSPEKQRVGTIAQCHGAVDQAWSPAEVAAVVVFELTLSGCDLSTDPTPYERSDGRARYLKQPHVVLHRFDVRTNRSSRLCGFASLRRDVVENAPVLSFSS